MSPCTRSPLSLLPQMSDVGGSRQKSAGSKLPKLEKRHEVQQRKDQVGQHALERLLQPCGGLCYWCSGAGHHPDKCELCPTIDVEYFALQGGLTSGQSFCVHISIHTYIYILTHSYTHTHTHTHAYKYVYISTYVRVHEMSHLCM